MKAALVLLLVSLCVACTIARPSGNGITVKELKSRHHDFDAYKLELRHHHFGDEDFEFKLYDILPHTRLAAKYEVVAGERASKKIFGVHEVITVTVYQSQTLVWEIQPVTEAMDTLPAALPFGITVDSIKSRDESIDAYKVSLKNKIFGDYTFKFKLFGILPHTRRLGSAYEVVGESPKKTYNVYDNIEVTVGQGHTLVWELQPVPHFVEASAKREITVKQIQSRDEKYDAYELTLHNTGADEHTFVYRLADTLPKDGRLAHAYDLVGTNMSVTITSMMATTVPAGEKFVWELQPHSDAVSASASRSNSEITVKQIKSRDDKFDAYELTLHNTSGGAVIFVFKLVNHLPKDGRLSNKYEVVVGSSSKKVYDINEKISYITSQHEVVVWELQPVATF